MARLLVVTDDRGLRDYLREKLRGHHKVIAASRAKGGLELALRRNPDYILLDLKLHHLSALEMCQILSQLRFTRKVPVIVASDQPLEESRLLCQSLGAAELVSLPSEHRKLAARLNSRVPAKLAERRAEDRAQIHVLLKLRQDETGDETRELLTTSEDLSPNGFRFACAVPLGKNTTFDVYLANAKDHFVGRARLVYAKWVGRNWMGYGFQFLDKSGDWIRC